MRALANHPVATLRSSRSRSIRTRITKTCTYPGLPASLELFHGHRVICLSEFRRLDLFRQLLIGELDLQEERELWIEPDKAVRTAVLDEGPHRLLLNRKII